VAVTELGDASSATDTAGSPSETSGVAGSAKAEQRGESIRWGR
jgi:hypothetical protein